MHLVYHSKDTIDAGVSPFVESLSKFDGADPLYLVCPYIGFSFFASLVNRSNNWRLITDLGEWFAVTPTKQLSLIYRLIKAEGNNIRHHPGVHAKVFWRAERALIGSANLTEKGLLARTEFGVELTAPNDSAAIAEVQEWYEWLWAHSTPAAAVNLGLVMLGRAESIKPSNKDQARKAEIRTLSSGTVSAESPLLAQMRDRFQEVQRSRVLHLVAAEDATDSRAESPRASGAAPLPPVQKKGAPRLSEIGGLLSPENRMVAQAIAVVEFLAETVNPEQGFSMAEVSSIFDEQLPDFSIRDLYFALSRSASNHPRGAFTIDAKHPLWVDEFGRFHRTAPEEKVFFEVDRILFVVIESIASTGHIARSQLASLCRLPRAQVDASLIALAECEFLRMYESRAGEYVGDYEVGSDADVLFATGKDRCRSALNRSFVWPSSWSKHFSRALTRWDEAVSARSNTYAATRRSSSRAQTVSQKLFSPPRVTTAKAAKGRTRKIWKIVSEQLRKQPRIELSQTWVNQVATEGRESPALVQSLLFIWRNGGKLELEVEGKVEYLSLAANDKTSQKK